VGSLGLVAGTLPRGIAPRLEPVKHSECLGRRKGVRVSTRHLDPPKRVGWVRVLPSHKAATVLLRQYIESRVGCADKHESACCKTFLGTLNAVQADDNAAGIDLVIRKRA